MRQLFLVGAVIASGCAVGPEYQAPELKAPTRFVEAPQSPAPETAENRKEFWVRFQDEKLVSLVDEAAERNLDLREGVARLREARALRRSALAELLPAVFGNASYSRQDPSDARIFGASNVTGFGGTGARNDFEAALDASWEIDLFGGTRRGVEAASAELEAQELALRDILLSISAETGRAYVEFATACERLDIAKRTVESHRSLVAVTRTRLEAGLASELDTTQAEALLAEREAQIPLLESLQKGSLYRLGVLTNRAPEQIVQIVTPTATLPRTDFQIDVGLPADLLKRRPDVRRAEREVASATARIGVATADLFPRFSLNGSFGYAGEKENDLTRREGQFWSFGPSVRWSLFQGGGVLAKIERADAQTEQALRAYERTVLSALHDVERSLVALSTERIRLLALERAVERERRGVELAESLYRQGLVDLLRVIDAQRALYDTEDRYLQSRGAIALNQIALFRALGGDWNGGRGERT